MSKKLRSGCAPKFEVLEAKQMLAGDVTVEVVDGLLTITGDDEANQVAISAGELEGTYTVQGLDGTTVTLAGEDASAEEDTLLVEGVTRGAVINTGAGDDVVEVSAAAFAGHVRVDTGAGNDTVAIEDARFHRGLFILAGDGDDTVQIGVAEDALVEDAEAVAEDTTESTSEAAANVLVKRGLSVRLGAGDDTLEVTNLAAGRVSAAGGAGADAIAMSDVHTRGLALNLAAGDAADEVSLTDVHARHARIVGGAGEQSVAIVDSVFAHLGVALGAADDTLSLSGVTARKALLNGGSGQADSLLEEGENGIGTQRAVNFELPTETEQSDEPVVTVAEPHHGRRGRAGRSRR